MNYGDFIKKERKKIGFSQKEMASKIGISASYLCNVEKNNRIPSQKIKNKIEIILKKKQGFQNNNKAKNKQQEKKYTKKELKEMEQEIIETYELMRDEKNVFSKIASVNRELIKINRTLEESFIKLDLLLNEKNTFFFEKIRRPLKTTKNNLKRKEKILSNKLEEIWIEPIEKEKNMDISNLVSEVPLSRFTKEQKRKAILVWVANNIKIRLKHYNFDKKMPSGYSTRLWVDGRAGNNNTRMNSTINENIAMNLGSASNEEEIKEIMTEISDGIIENSMIVTEEFLKAARNAKTESVKNRYIKASNNPEYLKVAFIISTLYYAKRLIELGQDLNHKVLEIKLQGLEDRKRELDKIWRKYGRGEISYEDASYETDKIFEIYEREITLSVADTDKIVEERLIYKLLGEKNLEILIDKIIDDIRERITSQISLFKNTEVEI